MTHPRPRVLGVFAGVLLWGMVVPAADAQGQQRPVRPTAGRIALVAPASATVGDTIVVVVHLHPDATTPIAALTLRVQWDTAALHWLGDSAGLWRDAAGQPATVLVNATRARGGAVAVTGYTIDGVAAPTVIRQLRFAVHKAGPTTLTPAVEVAGTPAGQSVRLAAPALSLNIRPR